VSKSANSDACPRPRHTRGPASAERVADSREEVDVVGETALPAARVPRFGYVAQHSRAGRAEQGRAGGRTIGVHGPRPPRRRLRARKLLGWPKRCKLAHAFRWEYSNEGLKLGQLPGQRGVFLTLALRVRSSPTSSMRTSCAGSVRRISRQSVAMSSPAAARAACSASACSLRWASSSHSCSCLVWACA
jgi:hypothetical protein